MKKLEKAKLEGLGDEDEIAMQPLLESLIPEELMEKSEEHPTPGSWDFKPLKLTRSCASLPDTGFATPTSSPRSVASEEAHRFEREEDLRPPRRSASLDGLVGRASSRDRLHGAVKKSFNIANGSTPTTDDEDDSDDPPPAPSTRPPLPHDLNVQKSATSPAALPTDAEPRSPTPEIPDRFASLTPASIAGAVSSPASQTHRPVRRRPPGIDGIFPGMKVTRLPIDTSISSITTGLSFTFSHPPAVTCRLGNISMEIQLNGSVVAHATVSGLELRDTSTRAGVLLE
ncbi:hypothetical protein HK101_007202, partial [Irineochytrium annulatum]